MIRLPASLAQAGSGRPGSLRSCLTAAKLLCKRPIRIPNRRPWRPAWEASTGGPKLARRIRILVLAGILAGLGICPGRSQEPWSISAEAVFPCGEPANPWIEEVILRLESPEGEGAPVTVDEFLAYCDRADPEVDRGALFRYARPGSIRNQDQDHAQYGRALMREEQLQAGVDFLGEQDSLLRDAEGSFGVARHDIVAILMWESALGKHVGRNRVFNVLLAQLLYLEEAQQAAIDEWRASGAADPVPELTPGEQAKRYAKLTKRAIVNLVALLRLSKAMGQDPTILLGSWAAAIGYPQFVPSSFKYAVDGDGDGLIDLNHWPDAIFSVASYLQAHGYAMSPDGRRRGIHRYNPIDSYVDGVIRYADAIRAREARLGYAR